MRDFIAKVYELRTALKNGDWLLAAQVAYEILGYLLAKEGNASELDQAVNGLTKDQQKELKAALKEIETASANPPRGTKSAVGGPAAILILQAVIPIITKLIAEWIRKADKVDGSPE